MLNAGLVFPAVDKAAKTVRKHRRGPAWSMSQSDSCNITAKETEVVMKNVSSITETTNNAVHNLPARQQIGFKTAASQKIGGDTVMSSWRPACYYILNRKAYTLIADMQLLPLPSKACLHQIITRIPCKYGYNQQALNSIKTHLNYISHLRWCGYYCLTRKVEARRLVQQSLIPNERIHWLWWSDSHKSKSAHWPCISNFVCAVVWELDAMNCKLCNKSCSSWRHSWRTGHECCPRAAQKQCHQWRSW